MQALLPTRELLPRVQLLILIVYHLKTVGGASLSSWKKLQMQGLLLTREILTHFQLIFLIIYHPMAIVRVNLCLCHTSKHCDIEISCILEETDLIILDFKLSSNNTELYTRELEQLRNEISSVTIMIPVLK